MKKELIIILILLLHTLNVCSQIIVSGTVINKEDSKPIYMVTIIEKGTHNGTITDIEGNFELTVSNPNAILVFSYVGMMPKEYKIKLQKENIVINLKSVCIIDTFDHKIISIFINSGVINNPIGGQFNFSFPAFLKATTLKTGISYQTNLDENNFLNAKIEFDHIILNCDFQMDLKYFYRNTSFDNDFKSTIHSIETDLIFLDIDNWNIYDIGFIAGYSNLSYKKTETNNRGKYSGVLIGLRAALPLHSSLFGRISFFKNNIEYQAQIKSGYKRFEAFVKFYKLNTYTELSLGVGLRFGY